MANVIQHIRSGTPGKIPLITDIDDGEIAINFFDGLMFIRKDDGVTQTIVQIGQFDATQIEYDNSVSLLLATTVQAAIDEIDNRVDFIENNPADLNDTLLVGNVTGGSDIVISTGDEITALVANGLTYPVVDGIDGDVMTTNGAGIIAFESPPSIAPNIEEVLINGDDANGQRMFGLRELIVEDPSPFITIKDTNANIGSFGLLGNIDFKDQNNTRWMYLGQESSGNTNATLLFEDVGNLNIRASNGLVVNRVGGAGGVDGQQVAVPAVRVSFLPRTSLGACSITNVINVLEVRRISVGNYDIRFDNGTINGTVMSNTGLPVCYSKTTQSSSVSHIVNWSSGTNLNGGTGSVLVKFYNAANLIIDPTGGANNYQTFSIYVN